MQVTTSRPTVRRGSKGEAVKDLQRILNAIDFGPINVDGDFGAKTEESVKAFQAATDLVADGIVGPKTWAALDSQGC